ncbi:DUF4139 domain-containing protein, partial [Kibdelosporangium lantanae]
MANRTTFARRFWFGEDIDDDDDENLERPPGSAGMRKLLKWFRANPENVPDWADAVRRFRNAEATVCRLADERQRISLVIGEFTGSVEEVQAAEQRLRATETTCARLQHERDEAAEQSRVARVAYTEIDEEYREHANHKPGFWIMLTTLFRAGRVWHQRDTELADQRVRVEEERDMVERSLATYRAQQTPDRRAVVVDLDVPEAGDVHIELSYVVHGARWDSSYDIRLTGETLALTWHAEITQTTDEDWPECELALSTAR